MTDVGRPLRLKLGLLGDLSVTDVEKKYRSNADDSAVAQLASLI